MVRSGNKKNTRLGFDIKKEKKKKVWVRNEHIWFLQYYLKNCNRFASRYTNVSLYKTIYNGKHYLFTTSRPLLRLNIGPLDKRIPITRCLVRLGCIFTHSQIYPLHVLYLGWLHVLHVHQIP